MRPVLVTLLLLASLSAAPEAAAQVRRCVDARGNAVYTDRACAAVDATPSEAPVSHAGAYASGFARRGCARNPDQLLDGVRGALEARDVNRLANYYHWTGTGTGAAKSLMDSLEAIAARPLVNAELVYPTPLPTFDHDAGMTISPDLPPVGEDTWHQAFRAPESRSTDALPKESSDHGIGPEPDVQGDADRGPADLAADPPAIPGPAADTRGNPLTTIATAAGPPPHSLLVQQMSGNADAGSAQVRFQLRRNAGCWWIEL